MSNCIYCDSKQHHALFEVEDIFKDSYQWHLCENCQVQFLDPPPTEMQLERAYDSSYYGEGESKFIPIVEKVVDYFRVNNAAKLPTLFGGKGRLLDIGCGNGNLLHYIGRVGDFELHGIEPEGSSADRAAQHKEINLKKGFLEEDTYPQNYFDGVSLIHVFEHLPNPKESLQIIDKVLKKDGVLVIEIPNIDSWQAKIFKSKWLHLDPPRHLQLFPPKVLIEELNKKGYELIQEKYFSIQYNPFGVQQSLLNLLYKDRELLYEHLKGNDSYTKGHSKFGLLLQKLFHWGTLPLFIFTDLWASLFKKSATVKLVFRKKLP